mgnify:CR=1 FL=1
MSFHTGIPSIDGSGIPLGSTIALVSTPACESLLYEFCRMHRTYYFTTERSPEFVREDMERLRVWHSEITFVNVHDKYYGYTAEDRDRMIVRHVEETLEKIGDEEVLIIIDTVSFFLALNVDFFRLRRMLSILYRFIRETRSLAVLHLLEGAQDETIARRVLNLCDVVIECDEQSIRVSKTRYRRE